MILHKPNFFVLTGGPGAGKTTLLRRLEAMGGLVVDESARGVIRDATANFGRASPWTNKPAFIAACSAC